MAAGLGAVLSGSLAAIGHAEDERATVLSIGDGDTLRVRWGDQRVTVRLACIDAPEMAQAPYGAQSRGYLERRLRIGAAVTLLPRRVDRYGRTVAEVIGKVNLSLAMVEDGQAFAYRKYLAECDAKEYLDAEYRASRHRYGVWQVPGGITRPWDFRLVRRSGGKGSLITPIPVQPGSDPGQVVAQRCRRNEIGSHDRAQW
jgi:endonuclease YncB( thermonuclease family)